MKDVSDRCRSQVLNPGVFYLSVEVGYKLHYIESMLRYFFFSKYLPVTSIDDALLTLYTGRVPFKNM